MSDVDIAHCPRQRAGPIGRVNIDQHPVDYVFCIFVERLSFASGSLSVLKIGQDCEVSRQIIAISNSSAGVDSDGGSHLGRLQVTAVSIQLGQVDH